MNGSSTATYRWGGLLVVALAIGSLVLGWTRLSSLPDLAVSLGPDLVVRTAKVEPERGQDIQPQQFQRGDRLVSVANQSVEELADVRAVVRHLRPTEEVDAPEARRLVDYQIVRARHRFTITLSGQELDPTSLPPGVQPTDVLVEVDGRPLPGKVGIEGLRSVIASRPEALLGFEREDALFQGQMVLSYSNFQYGYVAACLIALLFILALVRFSDPRLDPLAPIAVALETLCFAWVSVLAMRHQWVIADPALTSAVVASLVLVRPAAFVARAGAVEQPRTGAWIAVALAALAGGMVVALIYAGVLTSEEQALQLAALIGLLYIVYEIVSGFARGTGTTFGERSGYLAGVLALSLIAGAVAYFAEPSSFLEERWLWFAVIIVSLVWFGDVLYCFRGPANVGFAEIASVEGRHTAVGEYLDQIQEELPGSSLRIVVFQEGESVSIRKGLAGVEIHATSQALHDAMAILVQEQSHIPLPEGLDRHTSPMSGIAQTMQMSLAIELLPPSGAIVVPDTHLILTGFHTEKAGELPTYASVETLEAAQRDLSAEAWTAALVEGVARLSSSHAPPSVDREELDSTSRELDRVREELEEVQQQVEQAAETAELLRKERREIGEQAQLLAGQIPDVVAPARAEMRRLLEPELIEGVEYLLETDEPIVLGGAQGVGKTFVAFCAHTLDTRYPGPIAIFDAAVGDYGDEPQVSQDLLEAVLGGALFVRHCRALEDSEILRLLEASRESFRLFLSFTDPRAERRSVLEERAPEVRERLEHREMIIPNFTRRRSIQNAVLEHFLARSARIHRREIVGFSNEAARQLEQYDFPGQIEEARVMIETAVANTDGEIIDVEDLWIRPSEPRE